jgi:hypothetical protein
MASTINASTNSTSGLVYNADASGVLELQSNGVTGLTVEADASVTVNTVLQTANGRVEPLVLATARTASGTSVDFTEIPSWAKRITLTVFGISTNGTSSVTFRVGGTSGIISTGYFSGLIFPSPAWTSAAGFATNGLYVCAAGAAMLTYGSAILTKVVDNKWVWSGSFASDDGTDRMNVVSGGIDLGTQLTQVRVTTFSGTDTFDAGTINIMYE